MAYLPTYHESLGFNQESNLEAEDREYERNTPAYIAWVQQSLNQIMGAGLAVDGILGPRTRAAIRAFQTDEGLTIDGIVGPQTEAALLMYVAPPGSTTPVPRLPPAIPILGQLRSNIVRVAQEEWRRWNVGGTKTETDSRMRPILQRYWREGVGVQATDAQLASVDWQNAHPWSAAFISWVMRQAGAGNTFRYAAAHAVYISWAKQNRLANNNSPFKAYRITEVAPALGDLVCKSRGRVVATYDNIRPGMTTHCDIVTAVNPGELITIGGNVSDTVRRTRVRINANGMIQNAPYFAVIKVSP